MMALYPQGRPEWNLAGGFNLSRSGTGQPVINVHHNNDNRTYLVKVSEHFGYEQRDPGVNDPLSFTTGNKNDVLLIGGDAAGGQWYTDRIHSINLGEGNNTMIVGFGKRDLHVGIVTEGEDLGRLVARVGDTGWGNTQGVDDIKPVSGYYTDYHSSYLGGFKEIRMGSGNDALIVKQDVYRAAINLGDGNDDVFVGGNFHAAELYTGNGNDHLEFGQIGNSATVQTGADDDILTVHNINDGSPVIDLGADNDTLVLKGRGVVPTMNDHNIKGGAGTDTIVMDIDPDHANSHNGLTSKDFKGFEKIVMKRPGLLQIRSADLLTDNIMEIENGKKIIRVDNESGQSAKLNLGNVIGYETANGIPHSLADDHGSWTQARTENYENKTYTVYSYSHNGHTAEVWVYGNIEVL